MITAGMMRTLKLSAGEKIFCHSFFPLVFLTRQLGYHGGYARRGSTFGSVPARISMDSVECSGSEARLQDCLHSTAGNCSVSQGAGVVCFTVELRGGENDSSGNVFVENAEGYYGPVCDDGWDDEDAGVVCRSVRVQ